jgi:hypothetical protein
MYIETNISNARFTSWFSKKDLKKAVQPLLVVMHISFSYNTTPYHTSRKWQVLDQPGPLIYDNWGKILIFGKKNYFSPPQLLYIFRMVGRPNGKPMGGRLFVLL